MVEWGEIITAASTVTFATPHTGTEGPTVKEGLMWSWEGTQGMSGCVTSIRKRARSRNWELEKETGESQS